ncbi:MAG: PaaX family transcriptional regulator [Comamonadaceae bacterium]|nr:MAG: PaaX family transcriptional regulator [Comamonadaceae bacterium]
MVAHVVTAENAPPEVVRARRPQWLILMLMGDFAFERPVALSTGTFLDVLGQLDIGAHTARSTLQRMCDRGLLTRYRQGREVYFGLTERSTTLLRRGRAESWRPVDPEWDGTWTIVAFSIPEDRRATRQRLRSRLAWAGFGLLQSGLWIAPGEVDVAPLIDDLDVLEQVKAFAGAPTAMTTVNELIGEAYDIDELADRYRGFLRRWADGEEGQYPNALAALLVLQGEWQQVSQSDPRLPLRHLPPHWPGIEADQLFRARFAVLEAPARRDLDQMARSIDL